MFSSIAPFLKIESNAVFSTSASVYKHTVSMKCYLVGYCRMLTGCYCSALDRSSQRVLLRSRARVMRDVTENSYLTMFI